MNNANMLDETNTKSTEPKKDECATADTPFEKCTEMMGDQHGLSKAMESCPMASMCKSMTKVGRKSAGLALLIPGIVMILVGVLIFIQPVILAWLIAGTFIVLGIFALLMGNAFRKLMTSM